MLNRKLVPIFVIIFIVIGFIVIYLQVGEEKPDFKAIKNTTERKQAFINYLLPYIKVAEKDICDQREAVLAKLKIVSSGNKLSTNEYSNIAEIAKKYKLVIENPITEMNLKDLSKRVNVIPGGMVLAQSALETGWGTSRFAADYNNYFGEHCFTEGCGVKPKRQSPNKIDEVAVYSTPQISISNYLLLLNSSNRYTKLRDIRSDLLNQNKPISSLALINGLGSYSELGLDEYKNRLIGVIDYNKLTQYDQYKCDSN
jgi:Bax protein